MMTNTTTLPVEPELKARLEQLAQSTHRDTAQLVKEALTSYLQSEAAQIKRIQQGKEAADRGEFASDEDTEAFFKKWGE
jgi:RHH-type rel operon transcriptional repressor/antitoxin RelB